MADTINKTIEQERILILDDEVEILDCLEEQLIDSGFLCFKAKTSEQAISIMKRNPIDIILCDVLLNNENGMEFLRWVKRYDSTVRVIMMTANPSIDTVIQGQRLGGDDFIVKPISFPLLLLRIRHNLDMKNMNAQYSAMMLENERLRTIARLGITFNDQLNSPLTAIMGYIEFLRNFHPENEGEYQSILTDLDKTVEKIREKLKDLSNFSQLQEKSYPHSNMGMYKMVKIRDEA